MDIEYDINKSLSNKKKHGIDFEESQILWNDEEAIEFSVNYEDEERYAVIGKIKGKCWTAIITYRDKKTRIISVRRSRSKEVKAYENY